MTKLLLVEINTTELVPEEYADSWGLDPAAVWEKLEATPKAFKEYEELRIALDEKLDQIRRGRAD